MNFIKKRIFIILLIIILLYLVGCVYFNNAYLPNTYINEKNYGFKTVSNTENLIKNNKDNDIITLLKNDNTTEVIDLSTLKKDIIINGNLKEILNKQNNLYWVFSLFQKNYIEVEIDEKYDISEIDDILSNLNCVTSEKVSNPQNAYIEKTEDGYVIVPEKQGTLIDLVALKESVVLAINNNIDTINLETSNCYKKADITVNSDSIKNLSSLINNINSLTITYNYGDRTEKIESNVLKTWIVINEDNSIFVDEEKAKQFVVNMSYKYDTYQKERTFKTTNGDAIKVSGGIYGWQTDVKKTTEKLIEVIKEGKSVEIEPIYSISATSRETNDIGNTYIEVSIEKQHMWYYIDGKLFIETDVVTGLPNGKRDTPKGVFCLWSREKDRNLGSFAVEGYQSHVDYWMPIDWTGVGIHDASWRSSFGGSIYKTKGSHGCINTPHDIVSQIYENVSTGIPVIIY